MKYEREWKIKWKLGLDHMTIVGFWEGLGFILLDEVSGLEFRLVLQEFRIQG